MRKPFFIILLIFPTLLFSQDSFNPWKREGFFFYVGGGFSKSAFLEYGVAATLRHIGEKSKLIITVNNEIYSKPFLASVKSKFLLTDVVGPVEFGASLVYFGLLSDDWSLSLAPEIGVGIGRVRVFYNRNIFFVHPNFDKVSRNVLGLNFWLGKVKG